MTRPAMDRPGSPFGLGMLDTDLDHPPSLWKYAAEPDRIGDLHRLLGDFCHDFRNRLNSLQLYLYLAGEGGGGQAGRLDPLQATYRALLELIEKLQMVCRPLKLDLMELPLGLLVEDRAADWSRRAEARGLSLELRPPRTSVVGQFDPTRLAQAIDELAAWRLEAAEPGTRLAVGWRAGGDLLVFEWAESNAADPDDATLDERGVLPLAIASRVASAHGGRLEMHSTRPLRLMIAWPAALAEPSSGPGRTLQTSLA